MANKVTQYVTDNLEFYQMIKGVPIVMWDDDNPDDYIKGTRKADTVSGLGGNDYLQTGNGDDRADGGEGNDLINAGKGADYLDGGHGNDYLIGGRGNDIMYGGTGDDIIDAQDGSNTVYTGEGADRIVLFYDQVTMEGRKGNDTPFLWDGLNDAYTVIKDYTAGEDIIHIKGGAGNTIDYEETADYIDLMDGAGNIIVRVEKPVKEEGDDDFVPLTYHDLTIETGKFRALNEQLNVLSSEPPPLPLAEYEDMIEGTDGNDRLYGTVANDVFLSRAGVTDNIVGGGGYDTFVFRDEMNNGQVDMDFIRDFGDGDILDLGYSEINRVYTSSTNTYVYFGDDDDVVMLYNFTTFSEAQHVL